MEFLGSVSCAGAHEDRGLMLVIRREIPNLNNLDFMEQKFGHCHEVELIYAKPLLNFMHNIS